MSPVLPKVNAQLAPVKKQVATFVFLFFLIVTGFSQQTKIDSLKSSIKQLQQAQSFSKKDTVYINLLNNLGSELRYYKSDSLLTLSKQALQLSKDVSYVYGEAQALLRMGNYFSDNGDYKKAVEQYNESLKILEGSQNHSLMLRIMNNRATIQTYSGNYAQSLEGYLEGIELAEKVNDLSMLSIMNENIANLYVDQKDYEQGLVFYEKVKKLNLEIGNEIFSAETNSNIASIYADLENYEYAMFNINQSIATFEKHKILDWLAFAYEVKGKIYLKQDKNKWAIHWYNQSEALHQSLNDDRGKIDLYRGISDAYFNMQQDSISEAYALNSFKLSNEINSLDGIAKSAKTLYKINKKKEDYTTALMYHELYQKTSDTISRDENKKSLTLMKTKINHDQQQESLILESEQALAKQRILIYGALIIMAILLVIMFLIYLSKKKQNQLNRKLHMKKVILEKREIELEEINETKDKLFSIIGHDLRGPISALNELLKLYNNGHVTETEFLEFIPSLVKDVDHISFTLNNLLSWGQTQMNGVITTPSEVDLKTIVRHNMNLLGETARNKSIKIVNEVDDNTIIWSDNNQIDIVIRNLVSNSIKFTPENGIITIAAKEKNKHWQICVRDTGVGMDKETMGKLFSKNENLTTYGTNNEKGTGLGLSLCKEMVEKNNGTIWVDSRLKIGTSFYFTIPKVEKKYQNAS